MVCVMCVNAYLGVLVHVISVLVYIAIRVLVCLGMHISVCVGSVHCVCMCQGLCVYAANWARINK